MTVTMALPWAAAANHLWQSTAFALACALLVLALRKDQARARCWLWTAASLKFLIPFWLLIAAGSSLSWRTAPMLVPEALTSTMGDLGTPFSTQHGAANPLAAPPTASMSGIFLATWAIGCGAILLSCLVRWRRLYAIVRAARRLTEGREMEALRRVQTVPGFGAALALASSATSLEPGVFGIFKPVLLLPEGIADRLTDAQLEAIFTHELCHVRRRDNLISTVHMLIEAVFWFHPLVWWLGARLVEERERACDEEVLRLGGDSQAYAESILRACAFYLQAPAACISGVTGGELRRRVERIMRRQFVNKLSTGGKVLLAGGALITLLLPVFLGIANSPVARAQTASGSETFEAVSVKPERPGMRGRGFITDPGRMRMMNVTLEDCILVAYGIQPFQLEARNLPKDRYEILATAPTHPSRVLDARYESMMQVMLADRFGLKVHRDSKVLPVFAMEVVKAGPKLKPSEQPGLSSRSTPGHVTVTGITMLEWATYLTRRAGKPVVDLTGLKGLYDFSLDWAPGEGEASVEPPDPDKPRSTDPFAGPSLFTALQEQLGLKLTSKKLAVETIVVDHFTAPSEN